jgi:hypothetical protein
MHIYHDNTYPSSISGISSRGPDAKNTRPLSYLRVVANIALWAAGPKTDTTDCTLCNKANTEPVEVPEIQTY